MVRIYVPVYTNGKFPLSMSYSRDKRIRNASRKNNVCISTYFIQLVPVGQQNNKLWAFPIFFYLNDKILENHGSFIYSTNIHRVHTMCYFYFVL